MTVTERIVCAVAYDWTCETCGHKESLASMALQRSAETQHNSPRISWTRGGESRSPCEAMRIDRRTV